MLKGNNKDLNDVIWRRSGVFTINFEQVTYIALVIPLFTLSK